MRFENAMIPADVTTFEKLAVWAMTVLNYHGSSKTYKERVPNLNFGDDGVQRVFDRNGPFIAEDGSLRLVHRIGAPVAEDFAGTAYVMEYQAVREVMDTEPNVDFLNSNYQAP